MLGSAGILLAEIGVSSTCTIKKGEGCFVPVSSAVGTFAAAQPCNSWDCGSDHPSVGQMCPLIKIKPAEKALPSGHSLVCSPVTARMLSGQG